LSRSVETSSPAATEKVPATAASLYDEADSSLESSSACSVVYSSSV